MIFLKRIDCLIRSKMNRLIIIFFLVFLSILSCKNNPNNGQRIFNDSFASKDNFDDTNKGIINNENLISGDFHRLVIRLDSLGYKYDTNRYQKVYSGMVDYPLNPKYFNSEGFIFYNLPLEETIPYLFNEMKLLGSSRFQRDSSQEWKLNMDRFDAAIRINGYFFSSKVPDSYGNLKFTTDGIIEEWTFSTQNEAIEMSEELGKRESFVYFNRGAFICVIDNRVYVFHSRAVAFYGELKSFFLWFCDEFNAIIPNNGNLRASY